MNAPSRTVLSLKRAQAAGATLVEERLHKVLANAGLGSRRLLEQRIEAGEVRVNGAVAVLGSSVHAGDRVELDGKLFVTANDSAEHAQVLLFNKPEGVVTTREDPEGRPTVFELLPQLKGARWIAVGRLDINTTGLLLLTTDGNLAHALMHPSTQLEREYICRVHGEVTDEALERLKIGVELEDGPARFEQLAIISRGDSHSWFRIVIGEGRNREVRRMWESQGLMVSRLKRIRYGNIELPRGLLRGQSENLEAQNVQALRTLVGAANVEPTLTLQPVIGQRRAKPSNEFRPAPRTQQAWTAGTGDEARELRAFDRIRDDGLLTRPGSKRPRNNANGKKPPRGNGPNANRSGPRPPGGPRREGQRFNGPRQGGQQAGADAYNGNARPGGQRPRTGPGGQQRRGPGRGDGQGQPQVGIYQPKTWFAGDNVGPNSNRPPRRNGPRPAFGANQGNAGNPGNGPGAPRAPRNGPPRRSGPPGNGPRGDSYGNSAAGNRAPGGNQARGNPSRGNPPRSDFRPRHSDDNGNTAPRGLPRDDIGNRMPSDPQRPGGAPGGPRGRRRPPPRA